MSDQPPPLSPGTLLADRFEIERTLGRGAFGIAYLAADLARGDHAVIKELAPDGCRRCSNGVMELPSEHAARLRNGFLQEARTVGRLGVAGVPSVRSSFSENGTSYFAVDYLAGAQTLERILVAEGRLDASGALDILYACLEILQSIHNRGVLHRDIKPSNILIGPSGQVSLIDFGAAREWEADRSTTHTVLFTPTYAPLEQMAERAKRGPATDIFALCATIYEALAGHKPESATDRASGIPLTPLLRHRPDLDPGVAEAIEAGLELVYAERPQSASALRDLLDQEPVQGPAKMLDWDAKCVQLQQFKFEKRQCPACGGILEDAKPLARGKCPVCWKGQIRARNVPREVCPLCRLAKLKRFRNESPQRTCPACTLGWLEIKRRGITAKILGASCPNCNIELEPGELDRAAEKRSKWVWHCTGCGGQLDERPDGRLQVMVSAASPPFASLYPDEWDNVAAGLEPAAGNAECAQCGADYYLEGAGITLLAVPGNPPGFAHDYVGRRLDMEDIRWLGVGKSSARAGLVCQHCQTELDLDGTDFVVVSTPSRALQSIGGTPHPFADIHRIAKNLPRVGDEESLYWALDESILEEYVRGGIGFDSANSVLWKGPATNRAGTGTLSVTDTEFSWGGLLRKRKWSIADIEDCSWSGGIAHFRLVGKSDEFELEIAPIDLTVELACGKRTVRLEGSHLVARLNGR